MTSPLIYSKQKDKRFLRLFWLQSLKSLKYLHYYGKTFGKKFRTQEQITKQIALFSWFFHHLISVSFENTPASCMQRQVVRPSPAVKTDARSPSTMWQTRMFKSRLTSGSRSCKTSTRRGMGPPLVSWPMPRASPAIWNWAGSSDSVVRMSLRFVCLEVDWL